MVREREQKKKREREADEKRNFGIFFTSSFLFPAKTEKKIARNLPRSTRPVERTKKPKVSTNNRPPKTRRKKSFVLCTRATLIHTLSIQTDI